MQSLQDRLDDACDNRLDGNVIVPREELRALLQRVSSLGDLACIINVIRHQKRPLSEAQLAVLVEWEGKLDAWSFLNEE